MLQQILQGHGSKVKLETAPEKLIFVNMTRIAAICHTLIDTPSKIQPTEIQVGSDDVGLSSNPRDKKELLDPNVPNFPVSDVPVWSLLRQKSNF